MKHLALILALTALAIGAAVALYVLPLDDGEACGSVVIYNSMEC